MKLPKIRYNKYFAALDLFGALSLFLTVGYMLLPAEWQLNSRRDAMIANILSELIGIWVSVRLIEFFVSRTETHDRVRVRTVRNIRMLERLVSNILLLENGFEVQNLRREADWVEGRRPARKR